MFGSCRNAGALAPGSRPLHRLAATTFHDPETADLKPEATNNLLALVNFLNSYPNRTAAIEGYTDNVGSDAANQLLSERRAESVRSYLTGKGIGAARLAASGKGEMQPVADNESVTGRERNRRVEVIINEPVAAL
jgi:outer membrane protein OmpA-like peptidoglycan-associated protein